MSVVIETTLGDITVDLYLEQRPRACLNFLKLCKIKYYNYNLFHTISRGFIAQTGDPTGKRTGGESIFGVLDGPLKRYVEAENKPRIKHTRMGLISFVGNEENMVGSQFFITLGEDLTYLDDKHCVFGEVVEGFDVLEVINEVICDTDDRPYQDVRITHTVILDDPYPDPDRMRIPSRSPSPSAERLQGGRIAPDEEIDEAFGKSAKEIHELQAEREAKARATILEMVGDIPDADMAPPENVLFVCKLNPVTTDDDLEIIFSRFGKIKSCEVIRDRKTGDSLQFAFIEFAEQKSCEDAYFKMDNVLIDDRRIHVDFSQSVSKIKWHGKGRGVTHYDDKGSKRNDNNNDVGMGNYKTHDSYVKHKRSTKYEDMKNTSTENNRREYRSSRRSKSPKRRERTPKEKSRSPRRRSRSPSFRKHFHNQIDQLRRNSNRSDYDTGRQSHRRSPWRSDVQRRYKDTRTSPKRRSPQRRYSRSPVSTSRKRSQSPRKYNEKRTDKKYSNFADQEKSSRRMNNDSYKKLHKKSYRAPNSSSESEDTDKKESNKKKYKEPTSESSDSDTAARKKKHSKKKRTRHSSHSSDDEEDRKKYRKKKSSKKSKKKTKHTSSSSESSNSD